MLQKLLLSSPSLEKIVFKLVYGFKKFRVCNLGKLKFLDIRSDKAIEIDIEDAPSLCLLTYRGSSKRPCLLKVNRVVRNLKRLELCSVDISDNSLKELITKFPLLEHLEINTCDRLERINIVSGSLKCFNLNYCKNLVEAEIDAPSLLELEYFDENMLSLSLKNTPEELMTNIYLRHFGYGRLRDAWFHRLRELLKSISRARVSFALWKLGINFYTTLNLRENPLPLEHQKTENFMPMMNPSSSLFDVFMNTLFSCSRPTTIDSISLPQTCVKFMKFLSSELITATRNSNCCSSDQTKCWRHYLKNIKVQVYEYSQKVWQPLHEEDLQSDFTFYKRFRFSLAWYANLNAQV